MQRRVLGKISIRSFTISGFALEVNDNVLDIEDNEAKRSKENAR